MSLLCDYSDSSSSASEDEAPAVLQPAQDAAEDLPTVDDLFGGATAPQSSVRSSRAGLEPSIGKRAAPVNMPTSGDSKRPRRDETLQRRVPPEPLEPSSTRSTTLRFAPPQLKRPNVSTEDLGITSEGNYPSDRS
ncbi:hypothetical protein P43SY_003958 [Pythium insidiosum]|uniref:Uncharacterized protein n=1 Tax=Pythium insidiosum TaxID=114742 RepID=A0AAD5Q6Q9_PYTIN|nr:hypothetical protein P43SY_003958 [Pythium insidiosum]